MRSCRRIILAAGMIQREGGKQLADLSAELACVGERDDGFPLPHGAATNSSDIASCPKSAKRP